jgi:hypothetical protein
LVYAQETQDEPKPRPEESRPSDPRREASPPAHQNEVNPPRQQEEAKPPRQQEGAKPSRQESPENPKPPREENKPMHEQHGQQPPKGQTAQPGQHARPAGKSAHIPDPKFKASFGRQHTFAVKQVITTTTIVPGQTQFVMSGFTFIILDPWPAAWFFTDDCFIDFVDDEYFLFDVFHPGFRVALFVVG